MLMSSRARYGYDRLFTQGFRSPTILDIKWDSEVTVTLRELVFICRKNRKNPKRRKIPAERETEAVQISLNRKTKWPLFGLAAVLADHF